MQKWPERCSQKNEKTVLAFSRFRFNSAFSHVFAFACFRVFELLCFRVFFFWFYVFALLVVTFVLWDLINMNEVLPGKLRYITRRRGGRSMKKRSLFKVKKKMKNMTGSTIRTLLNGKINPKKWQVASPLVIQGFSNFRVVSGDYGKPCMIYKDRGLVAKRGWGRSWQDFLRKKTAVSIVKKKKWNALGPEKLMFQRRGISAERYFAKKSKAPFRERRWNACLNINKEGVLRKQFLVWGG